VDAILGRGAQMHQRGAVREQVARFRRADGMMRRSLRSSANLFATQDKVSRRCA